MTELSHEEVLNVEKTDHPDLVGGIVWADCELNWIRSYGVRCHEAGAKSERAVSDRLLEALKRVVGDHNAPNDCYATGPLTGDTYQDLVACPSCQAESLIAEVEAMRKEKPE